MKKLYAILPLLLIGFALQAQVERVPMFEIFSSSTCPPCKPASDIYNPLLDMFHGDLAVVKYPMSWPGAGDPYYMQEFDSRKSFYSVSGVPSLRSNGSEVSAQALDSNYFAGLLGEQTYIDLGLKYYIDQESNTIYYSVEFEALDNYFEGPYQMHWAINEKVTYDNATTNGETEFHHICKKLLPADSNGVIGWNLGDSIYSTDKFDSLGFFQFVGDYRLPSGAGDAIDISSENSIEENNDLEMMLWVNDMNTQEVIQAAVGKEMNSLDKVGDFGVPGGGEDGEGDDPTDPRTWPVGLNEVENLSVSIYPNPAKDFLNIELSTQSDFSVIMTDLLGKQVFNEAYTSRNMKAINVADMPEGVYMIQVKTDTENHFDRVVIK